MPLQSDRYRRHSDFISGLPVNPVANNQLLSNSERICLIHSYITSTPADGGLGNAGICPDAPEWDLVESFVTELYQGLGKKTSHCEYCTFKSYLIIYFCILDLFANFTFRYSSSTCPLSLSGYRRGAHKMGKPRTQFNLYIFPNLKNICSQCSSRLLGSRSHCVRLHAVWGRCGPHQLHSKAFFFIVSFFILLNTNEILIC